MPPYKTLRAFLLSSGPLRFAIALGLAINLLLLIVPLYTMSVYDKVLTSYDPVSLASLSFIALLAVIATGHLDTVRTRILIRAGLGAADKAERKIFNTTVHAPHGSSMPMRDLDTAREFLASPAFGALLDTPWIPFFVAAAWILHPWLGVLAVAGVATVAGVAVLSRNGTQEHQETAQIGKASMDRLLADMRSRAGLAKALGLLPGLTKRWKAAREEYLRTYTLSADAAAIWYSTTKMTRLAFQIGTICLAAILVIQESITPGAIMAVSIIVARAMAPAELVASQWPSALNAMASFRRIQEILASDRPEATNETDFELPPIKGHVRLEGVSFRYPADKDPLLLNVNTSLSPGKALAIVGPSGAGKSTLLKIAAGALLPSVGVARIDDIDTRQFPFESASNQIGYMPQDACFFDGTIADNIRRFASGVSDEDVWMAAQQANVHEAILRLPKGYETHLQANAANLSGGERQRIALARALLGTPRLLILDEPDTHLDGPSAAALLAALSRAKKDGAALLFTTHRNHLIPLADRIAVIRDGHIALEAPREEALKSLSNGARR